MDPSGSELIKTTIIIQKIVHIWSLAIISFYFVNLYCGDDRRRAETGIKHPIPWYENIITISMFLDAVGLGMGRRWEMFSDQLSIV